MIVKYKKCNKCKNYTNIQSCTINKQGEHHSFNDMPSMTLRSGTLQWHKNGKLHRDKAPAFIKLGTYKVWYYENRKMLYVKKISEKSFQYNDIIGIILEHIEKNIYLGLLGDKKYYIRTDV